MRALGIIDVLGAPGIVGTTQALRVVMLVT